MRGTCAAPAGSRQQAATIMQQAAKGDPRFSLLAGWKLEVGCRPLALPSPVGDTLGWMMKDGNGDGDGWARCPLFYMRLT